jgi:hypothetical protein
MAEYQIPSFRLDALTTVLEMERLISIGICEHDIRYLTAAYGKKVDLGPRKEMESLGKLDRVEGYRPPRNIIQRNLVRKILD